MKIPITTILVSVGALLTPIPSARAADITVSSTADSGPGTLRDAIDSTSADDEIVFDAGLNGATIRLTSGELIIDKRIGIDASNLPSGLTISGESTFRVFHVQADGVVFDSLTIANGKAPDATPSVGAAGGGGIFISSGSRLTLVRCTVRNNRAGDGFPVPDYVYGAAGGGIFSTGTLVVNGSTFHSNAAGDGVTNGANDGDGGSGGAILQNSGGTLTIRNSTFANNMAGCGKGSTGFGGSAGAIYSSGTTTLINSTIAGNAAGAGGSGDPGDNGIGGGLYLILSGGTADITNTIIAGNSAGPTGSPPRTTNDIFFVTATVNTTGVNLIGIGDGGGGSFPAPASPGNPNANGDLVGTVGDPLNPRLGSLANNGGPTLTTLPLPGSPAIDPVGGDAISTLTFDQRGEFRFVPDFVDIGSVEFNADDQARLDAAAQKTVLERQLKKLKRKLRIANRKKQVAKAKRISRQVRKLQRRIQAL